LLGFAIAVEKVRVGGGCWGLGRAVTSLTPRSTALRRVVQLILNAILMNREREGKRAKETVQNPFNFCTGYRILHLAQPASS